MKKVLTKRKLIFFTLLLCFVPLCSFGDILLAPGIFLRNEVSGDESEFLGDVIRQLDRYARRSGAERSAMPVVIICGKGDYFGFYGNNFLYLPGSAEKWRIDHNMRRRIYGMLASHRFNYIFPPDSEGLASWMVCAVDDDLRNAAASGRYSAANRLYQRLGGIILASGRLPSFAAMSRIGHKDDPLHHPFLAEQGRLLINIFVGKGKLKDIFEMSCADGKPDGFLTFFSGEKDAEEELFAVAEKMIWTQFNPLPADEALRRLDGVMHIFVPAGTENGEMSGNMSEYDWRQFAAYLNAGHENAFALSNRFRDNISRFGDLLCAEEERICGNMAAIVKKFISDREAQKMFEAELKKLEDALRRRSLAEKFMQEQFDKTAVFSERFNMLFKGARSENPACGAESALFLHDVMNGYSQ